MGNDLEKEYQLKQKPIKLPGSYCFLKFVHHPTDDSSSLIVVKEPHKVGVISSNILLPIREVTSFSSDYTIARCTACTPLSLFKPRSESEMKLILWSIIKISSQLGRIFLCRGRLMLWCEEIRSLCSQSPEQIQNGKKHDNSKVFVSGICLINFLECVYGREKSDKKKKTKEIETFFNPKDKKQYLQFTNNIEVKLGKSNFWSNISEGMRNLILVMLTKHPSDRIGMNQLLYLPYFADEKQLKLYQILADSLPNMDEKQTIIVMETLEMVLKNRIIIDDLINDCYFTPLLLSMLEKNSDMILSALLELPSPPLRQIYDCLKKGSVKNHRLITVALNKKQKLHSLLEEEWYDNGISRIIFASYQSPGLIQRAIYATPYLIKSIKQANYRKQIEYLLIHKVLENTEVSKHALLLGLKCIIHILEEKLLTSITKLYGLFYNPLYYEEELEINLHILYLYQLMTAEIDANQVLKIMMPKLQPYLSNSDVTDQLFYMAKHIVGLMMEKLTKSRQVSEQMSQQFVKVDYEPSFFEMLSQPKPTEQQIITVLRKEVLKSKNEHILWLDCILKKQHLIDL